MTTHNTYAGDYPELIQQAAQAAIIANVHICFVSRPGWGKSDIAEQTGRLMAGESSFHMVNLTEGSSPTEIAGRISQKAIIERGEYEMDYADTPFHNEMRVMVMDEVSRASMPALNALLHATDPLKQDHCAIIGTTNFVPKAERSDALRDRFALWFFLPKMPVSDDLVAEIIESQMNGNGRPVLPLPVPSWDEVETIRATKPSENARAAVGKFVREIAKEAQREGFEINPRWVSHMRKVVYYNSVHELGTGDFEEVPTRVRLLARYVYPSKSPEQAKAWGELVTANADPVGARIESILGMVTDAIYAARNATSETEGTRLQTEITSRTMHAMQELNAMPEAQTDNRVREAIQQVSVWLAASSTGDIPA